MSFANHSRMMLSFYESFACVKDGETCLCQCLSKKFKDFDVDVRCATITERTSPTARWAVYSEHREEITSDTCVLTIHPKEILKILPQNISTRRLLIASGEFESSVGFFSVFATIKPGTRDPYPDAGVTSLFPIEDVNQLLNPVYQGDPAVVIIKSPGHDAAGKAICILEPSHAEHVAPWSESRRGKRPGEYLDYKKHRIEAIMDHVCRVYPSYRETLEIVDAASSDIQGLPEQSRQAHAASSRRWDSSILSENFRYITCTLRDKAPSCRGSPAPLCRHSLWAARFWEKKVRQAAERTLCVKAGRHNGHQRGFAIHGHRGRSERRSAHGRMNSTGLQSRRGDRKSGTKKIREETTVHGRMASSLQAADEAIADAAFPFPVKTSAGDCVVGSTMGSAKSINDTFETMLPNKT
jgi:hypothetical protein